MRAVARTALAVGAVGASCVTYGTLIERRWYRLRRLALPGALRQPARTPDGRLRILHVSDLHLAPGQDHRVRFLGSLSRLDHDLVVATGDLLGATDVEDATADALAPLTSGGRPGLVVLGSNDLYAPVLKSPAVYFRAPSRGVHGPELDTPRFEARLAEYGYRTLHGEAAVLDLPAGRIGVAGFDDPHLPTTVLPPVADVTPTAGDAVVHLGLVHAPYLAALDVLVEAGHDVLLAGHTHGGQVRLPGIGALVANCDLPLDQARGESRYRGRWLHVSPGLGHSRYAPFRFACRPEATLLELSA